MTEEEASEVVSILAKAYGMAQRRLSFYAEALAKYPAGIVAEVIEQLVETEKGPPTIAVIVKAVRRRLEAIGATDPTFQGRGDRMEAVILWRSVLEDQTTPAPLRQDAYDRVTWMDPPCTHPEWREARVVADDRWVERNKQRQREGLAPYPPRPVASLFAPPGPPDPQPVLSQAAHLAGIRALYDGYVQQMGPAPLRDHVLTAVRSAERDARAQRIAGGPR